MTGQLEKLAEFDISARTGKVPPAVVRILFGLICFAAFVFARTAVDLAAPTAGPFALIYPALLIATLFGCWQAGLTTYAAALAWVWLMVLPKASLLTVVHPGDGPRTLVNGLSLLVILVFAEAFRRAIRRATGQRDELVADLRDRESRLQQEVEQRTRELSETWRLSPDLLGVLNRDGFFEATNPAWQVALGWSEEAIRTTRFLEFIHPDDIGRTNAAWEDVNDGNPVRRFENRFRRPDGTWRWLSWVVVPEGDKFYCSARDVTDIKEQDSAFEQMQEALRQSQKLEAIGQLTGGVAHDFNNLLTVIGGSASLLRKPGLAEDRREKYLEAITTTVTRASRLTAQLLAFARRQALKPEVFDIGRNVHAIRDIVKSLTGSRITIETKLPEEPCYALADPSQFDTAIINLAVNARDAMNGEGKLVLEVSQVDHIPAVRAHDAVAGNFVAICVIDGGCGIAADRLERVFEPFFTTKGVGEGTGLGLSQVFGFAKQSNGEVRVESEEGRGSTFTLYLPRAITPSSETASPASEALPNGDGLCVLVVEDNAEVLEFATQTLSELGYNTVHAANAEAALSELARDADRFDVVFTDVVMPGMNGIELGQEIRRLHPSLPVVLTSGYSHVLAQNGTFGFDLLHKPYSMDQLAAALKKAARWKGARAR